MNSKFFNIGGIIFEIKSKRKICDSDLFDDFRIKPRKADFVIDVIESCLPERDGEPVKSFSNQEIYYKNGKRLVFSYYPKSTYKKIYYSCCEDGDNITKLTVDYDGQLYDSVIFRSINFNEMLFKKGCFLFHCSFIVVNSKAILFSGDSGKGKSTQADLWHKYRNAEIINGDRAILKLIDGKLYAYGTPYCGSSKISVNKSAEVSAVIFPEHYTTNEMIRFDFSFEKINLLLSQLSSFESADYIKFVSFAEKILSSVPLFTFKCLPDKSAVDIAEKELKSSGILTSD